jgi:xanthine dehydrogenase/oxidase
VDTAALPVVDGTTNTVAFTLNGAAMTVTDPDPGAVLVDLLRSPDVGLTGTKLVCGQSGCGACAVVVTRTNALTGQSEHVPVNSCLFPVCELDGVAVTTVEGVGSVRAGLHPVQQRLVDNDGTQCGFCTPGWVMSMVGLLATSPTPTADVIEDYFDGNLCRCTGMRPILDAMQSFASDPVTVPALPPAPASTPGTLHFAAGGREWYRPTDLATLRSILFGLGQKGTATRVVHGGTSRAMYPEELDTAEVLVDASRVPEIHQTKIGNGSVFVGGGVTVNELRAYAEDIVANGKVPYPDRFAALALHLGHVGNNLMRNVGSIAGNLVLERDHQTATAGVPFPSDLVLMLKILDAQIIILPADPSRSSENHPPDALPDPSGYVGGYVIGWVAIPFGVVGETIVSYKIAKRAQNAHAMVNAAVRVVPYETNPTIAEATIVFGGLARSQVEATAAAAELLNQPWSTATRDAAAQALANELPGLTIPLPGDAPPVDVRIAIAEGLFLRAWTEIGLAIAPSVVPPTWTSAGSPLPRPISTGEVAFPPTPIVPAPGGPDQGEDPVGEAMHMLSAPMQTTGEARYTQDLPAAPGMLHAAYAYSTRMKASFTYTDGSKSALLAALQAKFPGVAAIVDASDITAPKGNQAGIAGEDPVFAPGQVTAYGQPILLVLADTDATARAAAAWVMEQGLTYVDITPAWTTIQQALQQPPAQGRFSSPFNLTGITRPNPQYPGWLDNPGPLAGKQFLQGTIATGAQSHFYFETQSVVAIPGEPGELELFVSSQDLASCQGAVATALGIPASDVTVTVMRVGGGFGGKETRPPMIAAAAGVAANATGKPVRLVLDRETDMASVGTRHPYEGAYYVLFDADGTIDAMRIDFYSNGGSTIDVTLDVSDLALLTADGSYMIPTFRATSVGCRTNLISRTAMRSFGVIQCSLIVEDAIEQVAHALGMRPEDVRLLNMYADSGATPTQSTPYGQPLTNAVGRAVWSRLTADADFATRSAAVDAFNQANRWRKKGISMIPIKYGISYTFLTGNQGGALLTVSQADGSVLIATGGVEMGQGLETKLVQLAAYALKLDPSRFRHTQTDTEVVPNASSTGASTGADLNGGAVWLAATELYQRLQAYCANPPPNHLGTIPAAWQTQWSEVWPGVVQAAYTDRIDLSAQALYSSPNLSEVTPPTGNGPANPFYYFTWSAACSEVEIDVLTGEFEVVRTDILYDAGLSLNPYLDLGQVQGGFVQGLGNVTTEEMLYDDQGGPITDNTWTYKPPCTKTIPADFRVALLTYEKYGSQNGLPVDTYGIQSSKSAGEPPLVLANTVFFALKHAVAAARADNGDQSWPALDSPATVERIRMACLPDSG